MEPIYSAENPSMVVKVPPITITQRTKAIEENTICPGFFNLCHIKQVKRIEDNQNSKYDPKQQLLISLYTGSIDQSFQRNIGSNNF